MMIKQKQQMLTAVLLASTMLLAGCDKVAGVSRSAQEVTRSTFNDTKSSWRDFFTYHPPEPDPLPQTRYCYQMQSDVVCYDSEQRTLTSKLVGFQDGDTISWVQPGGGSLGASGGEPIALRPIPQKQSRTNTKSLNDFLPFEWPSTSKTAPASQGAIDVNSLPPINSVATVGTKVN
jgi:hypothetical protein